MLANALIRNRFEGSSLIRFKSSRRRIYDILTILRATTGKLGRSLSFTESSCFLYLSIMSGTGPLHNTSDKL